MSLNSFSGEDIGENTEWKLPALVNASRKITLQDIASSLLVPDIEDSDSDDDLPLQELIKLTTRDLLNQ